MYSILCSSVDIPTFLSSSQQRINAFEGLVQMYMDILRCDFLGYSKIYLQNASKYMLQNIYSGQRPLNVL